MLSPEVPETRQFKLDWIVPDPPHFAGFGSAFKEMDLESDTTTEVNYLHFYRRFVKTSVPDP
jgi:hypothetical protein